jgi:tetratricopeptide (TPR) repeat protein
MPWSLVPAARRLSRGFLFFRNARTRHAGSVFGLGVLFSLIWLSGCSALQTERVLKTAAHAEPVELKDTPFFPQEDFQCGPAALATLLNKAGVPVSPAQLTPQVYLPEREGSLQVELLAAARNQARVPYVLAGELEAVLAEVAAGNPVLVLQNLGLSWAPRWHYAVVVGFDLGQSEVVLRSGREERHALALSTFEHTWARSGHWAVVIPAMGKLPETAQENSYVSSVVALERLQKWEAAAAYYAAALKRWPKNLGAQVGLGNSHYALKNLNAAEAAFRRATQQHPTSAVAHNNLAQALLDRGCLCAALRAAEHAVALEGPWLAVSQETLGAIAQRLASENRACAAN